MAEKPQPTCATPLQISAGPTLRTYQAKSTSPSDGGDDAGEIRASWTGIGGSGRRRPVEWHAVII